MVADKQKNDPLMPPSLTIVTRGMAPMQEMTLASSAAREPGNVDEGIDVEDDLVSPVSDIADPWTEKELQEIIPRINMKIAIWMAFKQDYLIQPQRAIYHRTFRLRHAPNPDVRRKGSAGRSTSKRWTRYQFNKMDKKSIIQHLVQCLVAAQDLATQGLQQQLNPHLGLMPLNHMIYRLVVPIKSGKVPLGFEIPEYPSRNPYIDAMFQEVENYVEDCLEPNEAQFTCPLIPTVLVPPCLGYSLNQQFSQGNQLNAYFTNFDFETPFRFFNPTTYVADPFEAETKFLVFNKSKQPRTMEGRAHSPALSQTGKTRAMEKLSVLKDLEFHLKEAKRKVTQRAGDSEGVSKGKEKVGHFHEEKRRSMKAPKGKPRGQDDNTDSETSTLPSEEELDDLVLELGPHEAQRMRGPTERSDVGNDDADELPPGEPGKPSASQPKKRKLEDRSEPKSVTAPSAPVFPKRPRYNEITSEGPSLSDPIASTSAGPRLAQISPAAADSFDTLSRLTQTTNSSTEDFDHCRMNVLVRAAQEVSESTGRPRSISSTHSPRPMVGPHAFLSTAEAKGERSVEVGHSLNLMASMWSMVDYQEDQLELVRQCIQIGKERKWDENRTIKFFTAAQSIV
jgi:hypothetical protein